MNILFFLTPKSEVAYINEDDTLRQALEKICSGELKISIIWT